LDDNRAIGAIFLKLSPERGLFLEENCYLCPNIYYIWWIMDKNRLIEIIVDAIQDKKGKDIVSLDLEGFDGAICSNFVVCNADSPTQVAAIADSIEEKVFVETGENPWRVEGKQTGLWVAVDFIDVVVHIFTTDLRGYYRLEELWADAPMTRYDYEL